MALLRVRLRRPAFAQSFELRLELGKGSGANRFLSTADHGKAYRPVQLGNVPFQELLTHFFFLASPLDLVYSLIKSMLFGAAIAVLACYHGLNPRGRSINAVPQAAIRAVTEALLLVMLLNVVFAYLVYGVAFFGLVTAQQ